MAQKSPKLSENGTHKNYGIFSKIGQNFLQNGHHFEAPLTTNMSQSMASCCWDFSVTHVFCEVYLRFRVFINAIPYNIYTFAIKISSI